MPLFHTIIASPIDPLLLISDGTHLCGCYFKNEHQNALIKTSIENPNLEIFQNTKAQLKSYFAGQLKDFHLPLKFIQGTPFQQSAWQALKAIPYGKTISYLELAQNLGNSKGARPIGGAIGKNPISIIIPCHRVIGKNGKLTGFGGGLPRKEYLLKLEGQIH